MAKEKMNLTDKERADIINHTILSILKIVAFLHFGLGLLFLLPMMVLGEALNSTGLKDTQTVALFGFATSALFFLIFDRLRATIKRRADSGAI